MSAPDLEAFFRTALSLGMPAHDVDILRRNPQQLLSLLAGQQTQGSDLHLPMDATPDDLAVAYKAQIDSARARFEAEQKRPLRSPPAADRRATIADAERARSEAVRRAVVGEGQLVWNYMGAGKHSSSTPLEELKPIRFKDMQVTKMHKGRYLLCRIVSSPMTIIGLSVVVEDEDGRVDTLSLYNLSLHGLTTGPDLDALFPRGTILAIREPTYKPDQTDTSHLVRVESPTDYEVLSPKHPLVKCAKWATSSPVAPRPASFDFKALGNRYFVAKKDLLAVKAYSDGLDSTDDAAERLVLFLNRSQAYIRLGNFALALRDTTAVLAFLASDVAAPPLAEVKATLRRARALEGLRQLKKARAAFEHVVELDSRSAEARAGMRRVEGMLDQSATGEYDWCQLIKDLEKGVAGWAPAVGDYVGPVKAVEIEGRGGGRGVVATRDIKAGELLSVEKAFATGEPTAGRVVMGFNFADNSASEASELALVTACADKIKDDPSAAALIYALHGGNKAEPIGTAVLGAQQDRDFGSSAQPACADIARIEQICITNSFGLRETTPDEVDKAKSGSALFLGGSLFNHSCAPNAIWRMYGDVQVIRARQPIRTGDEVFIAYVPAEAPQSMRKGVLRAHFADGCTCAYCADERIDSPQQVARRAELIGPSSRYIALRAESKSRQPVSAFQMSQLVRDLKRIVQHLEATYSPRRGSYRPDLVEPCLICAHAIGSSHATDATRLSAQYDLKGMVAAGAEFHETPKAVEVVAAPFTVTVKRSIAERFFLKIAGRNGLERSASGDAEARKWIKAAAAMARITHGLDWDGFVERAEADFAAFNLKRLLAGCST